VRGVSDAHLHQHPGPGQVARPQQLRWGRARATTRTTKGGRRPAPGGAPQGQAVGAWLVAGTIPPPRSL